MSGLTPGDGYGMQEWEAKQRYDTDGFPPNGWSVTATGGIERAAADTRGRAVLPPASRAVGPHLGPVHTTPPAVPNGSRPDTVSQGWPEDRPAYRTSWHAPELLAAQFPAPRFAVPGLVPEGLTLTPGAPKLGKSWLWLGIALAIAQGSKALGCIPVEQGLVLYLALEDPPRRLQQRLRMLLGDEPAPAGLHFETEWPNVSDGGIESLRKRLESLPGVRLVVIDVLARMRPAGSDHANRYDADYAIIAALKHLADEFKVAIVVVHHTRKSEAKDFVDTVSGTHGLAGSADSVAVLQRSRGGEQATLSLTGRDIEEAQLALRFEAAAGRWSLLGDAGRYALTDERRSVVELIERDGPMSPKQVAEKLDIEHDNAKQRLRRMAEAGELVNNGKGTYALPLSPLSPLSPSGVALVDGDASDTGDTHVQALTMFHETFADQIAEEHST